MYFKELLIVFTFPLLIGCKGDNGVDPQTNSIVKDTINVVDIVSDFKKRLNSTGEGVSIQFFDKKNNPVTGLTVNDTFFVRVDYISDTFNGLAKNHDVELFRTKGNFKFLGQESKNKYKLSIGQLADTIEFDVFIKSTSYIFNDYFMKDGEIEYELTDRIHLCRLTELPASK